MNKAQRKEVMAAEFSSLHFWGLSCHIPGFSPPIKRKKEKKKPHHKTHNNKQTKQTTKNKKPPQTQEKKPKQNRDFNCKFKNAPKG